jgi:hypothetical protein
METIAIRCDSEKRNKSIERLRMFRKKGYLDRVPVLFGVEARYLLSARGAGFLEYFQSPESNFRHQLMNFKWRMEHLEDDGLGSESVTVFPDFQNTTTAGLFNFSAIAFRDTEPPRVLPFITSIEELRRLEPPDLRKEMGGKKSFFLLRMKELAKDFTIEVNGEPIPIIVGNGWHETMGTGAIDMLGENFFAWLMEYPREMKDFLQLLTKASIDYETMMRGISGVSADGGEAIADGMEMLSREMFDEFIVAPYLRYYEAFPGYLRGLHMCGRIDHLLASIRCALQVTMLNGFGYCVDRTRLARVIGPQMSCSGGLNPMTLWSGSDEEVRAEVRSCIAELGPSRAFILGDGYNVIPGTPAQRMNGVVRQADEIGLAFLSGA